MAGLSGKGLGFCTLLGPIIDKAMGLNLDKTIIQALEQARRERIEKEKDVRIESLLKPVDLQDGGQATESQIPLFFDKKTLDDTRSRNTDALRIEEERKWREVITHPSVVLILGKRGSGKSALGYYLLELLHTAYPVYVIGAPETAQNLLPDYVGIVPNLEMLPPNSVAVVDEAHLRYHARQSNTDVSILMSKLLNISRQKSQTIIFVSQEARQIDRNIVSSADVIIFKDLGLLQTEFDRREINRIAIQAKGVFDSTKGNRKIWSYVHSPNADFIGPLKNSLPSFWSSKLSTIFANNTSARQSVIKTARNMTRNEKIKLAKELKQNNHSIGQIAKILGISRGTVFNYLNDYPHRNT